MSNTVIQIKRSQTTAVPGSLAEGELAYSGNGVSNSLFIGLPDGGNTVTRIAGGKYGFLHNANTGNSTVAVLEGGNLTANAAMITDANSFISGVRTKSLVIQTTSGNNVNGVTSISVFANTTQLGANAGGSNTELVTSDAVKVYVDGRTAALGAAIPNTYIVFSNSGTLSGVGALTFNETTNTVAVANAITVGSNVTITNSSITVGNSSVNVSFTQTAANIDGTLDVSGAVSVTNTIGAGNTTITGFANISSTLAAGNTTITGFANVSSTLAAGNTTVSGFANVSGNVTVGADLQVNGNTALGSATSDVISFNGRVNTSIIPSANVTYDLGSSGLRYSNVYATNIAASGNGDFQDITVSGNLTINGTLTTINANNLTVTDSLIQLAKDNTTSDSVDIGFFGNYQTGGGDHEHTGLFRDASDGIYKLFSGLTVAPTTVIDTSNNTYTTATLQTYLLSSVLVANSTVVNITANSTVSSAIVANSVAANVVTVTGASNNSIFYANSSGSLIALSLGTDGQILQSNGSAVVYGHLDGGTF